MPQHKRERTQKGAAVGGLPRPNVARQVLGGPTGDISRLNLANAVRGQKAANGRQRGRPLFKTSIF